MGSARVSGGSTHGARDNTLPTLGTLASVPLRRITAAAEGCLTGTSRAPSSWALSQGAARRASEGGQRAPKAGKADANGAVGSVARRQPGPPVRTGEKRAQNQNAGSNRKQTAQARTLAAGGQRRYQSGGQVRPRPHGGKHSEVNGSCGDTRRVRLGVPVVGVAPPETRARSGPSKRRRRGRARGGPHWHA